MKINLKRLVLKKEITSILNVNGFIESPVFIQDSNNRVLYGKTGEGHPCEHPVKLEDEVIGWVSGEERASAVASLLSSWSRHSLRPMA